MSGTIKTILEELKDLKRLRDFEIRKYKRYNELLSYIKPMTKKDKLFSWLIPTVVFVGMVIGTIYFFKYMFVY